MGRHFRLTFPHMGTAGDGSSQGALRRTRLVELGDGGFDNLAGPLGRDAVLVCHILQPATVAAVAKVELGGHKIALTPGEALHGTLKLQKSNHSKSCQNYTINGMLLARITYALLNVLASSNCFTAMNNNLKTSSQLVATIMGDAQSAKWTEFVNTFDPILREYSAATFPDLDADDLIQETFRALIEKMPRYQYDPEANGLFRNYLIGILRHKAFAVYRTRMQQDKAVSIWLDVHSAQSVSQAEKERDEFKQAAMELALREFFANPRITDQSKQIFRKVAIEGLPPADVAAAFGVTRDVVDQVRSRMNARLRKIVARLEGPGGE